MSIRLCTAFIVLMLATLVSSCTVVATEVPDPTASPAPTTMLQPTATLSPSETATSIPTETATLTPIDTPEPTSTLTATKKPYELISSQYYVVESDQRQKLSLFLPHEGHRKPQTLLLQSGQYFPDLVDYFLGLGYPLISFNARDDSYMTEIQDGFCALAWAHTNADIYGFDAGQIIPVGGSMLGGNAALLGLVDDPTAFLEGCHNELPETGRVRAIIALAGVFDYSEVGDFFVGFIDAVSSFMGGEYEQVPENWETASAINWVQADAPPFLLVHGTADTNVAPGQSEKFAMALEAVGTDVELVLLPGVDHYTSVTDVRVFEAMLFFLEGLE